MNAIQSTLAVATFVVALAAWNRVSANNEDNRLVVHEWGTFTVLQDAKGNPIKGVNINEEALPDFVHRLAADLAPEANELAPALGGPRYSTFQPIPPGGPGRSKGLARAYRLAIMRMETPIIYFYPPERREMTLDVSVQFRNGWLSEWYPEATNNSPGYPGNLGGADPGSLSWKGLKVGVNTEIPSTDEHVWQAPRQVGSARVRTPENGEAEQYLFYRGVAQLESPIRVVTDPEGGRFDLRSNLETDLGGQHFVEHLWLADIRSDGKVAFRSINPVSLTSEPTKLSSTASTFPPEAYLAANLPILREEMHQAITQAGLFDDEATAMLNTWELSYFKSAGMRLFYVLPDAWTNHQLPLRVSEPADIVRVMIGRIELITPGQEQSLAAIAAGPTSSPQWLKKGLGKLPEEQRAPLLADLKGGVKSVTELDRFEVPADYRAYIELGRFRDAIVLNRAGSNKILRQFAWNYGITLH